MDKIKLVTGIWTLNDNLDESHGHDGLSFEAWLHPATSNECENQLRVHTFPPDEVRGRWLSRMDNYLKMKRDSADSADSDGEMAISFLELVDNLLKEERQNWIDSIGSDIETGKAVEDNA